MLSNIRLDDLDCKIYFVNNDLFTDQIVNPTNEKFLDFEKEISSDLTTPKLSNKNFSSIFSFSYINNLNTNYLQYRSYTNSIVDDITSIDFFQFLFGDPMVIQSLMFLRKSS